MKPWRAFMLVWMNYRLKLRGFAFKGTDLIYIHYVSKENFAITVKGFTFVSLVCWEVHISYVENICKRRRSLFPAVVANLPADELFAGVRGPELIRILKFLLWGSISRFCDCLRLVNRKKWSPELLLCFNYNYIRHHRGQCEVCCETVSLFYIS